MFVRATVTLERIEEATMVPEQALAVWEGQTGVFVLGEAGASVAWRPVRVGVLQDQWAQISGEGLVGRVVILGQQLLEDGSVVSIPDEERTEEP
jgi:hypothetical protein